MTNHPTTPPAEPEVLFFGCGNDEAGHHLNSKRRSVRFEEQPWRNELDTGLLKPQFAPQSPYVHIQKDGWSVVSFWDGSGADKRPGCNTAFLCKALVSAEELLRLADGQWPEITRRIGFPVKIPSVPVADVPAIEPTLEERKLLANFAGYTPLDDGVLADVAILRAYVSERTKSLEEENRRLREDSQRMDALEAAADNGISITPIEDSSSLLDCEHGGHPCFATDSVRAFADHLRKQKPEEKTP